MIVQKILIGMTNSNIQFLMFVEYETKWLPYSKNSDYNSND